ACKVRVELDLARLGLLAPEGMSGCGERHALAGAGIENEHRRIARHQYAEGCLERRRIGMVIHVLGEMECEQLEHKSAGVLLVGRDEVRKHALACSRGWVKPLPLPASKSWPDRDRR